MKDREFIELLNLYLDHEISGPDAARLEAEVQSNAGRQKIYQQYCRMQKACRMLTSDFATTGESAADRKVVGFEEATAASSPPRSRGLYPVAAFAAAAACLALIFVTRSRQEARQSAELSSGVAVVMPEPSTAATPAKAPAPRRGGLVSIARQSGDKQGGQTLVTDPLLLTRRTQAEAAFASAAQQSNDQLAWIHSVQLAPIQQRVPADDLRFDLRPATLRPDGRELRNTQAPVEAAVEMTAFRITK